MEEESIPLEDNEEEIKEEVPEETKEEEKRKVLQFIFTHLSSICLSFISLTLVVKQHSM